MNTETKIEITAQHLTGNSFEGFNDTAWVAALEQEYMAIAQYAYPAAQVIVKIDVQNMRGCGRDVQVFGDEDNLITSQIENAANALYDDRGDEFYSIGGAS